MQCNTSRRRLILQRSERKIFSTLLERGYFDDLRFFIGAAGHSFHGHRSSVHRFCSVLLHCTLTSRFLLSLPAKSRSRFLLPISFRQIIDHTPQHCTEVGGRAYCIVLKQNDHDACHLRIFIGESLNSGEAAGRLRRRPSSPPLDGHPEARRSSGRFTRLEEELLQRHRLHNW